MGSTRTMQRTLQPTAARTTAAAPAQQRITPAPATPSVPTRRPHGDLSRASAPQIVELVNTVWPTRQPRAWLRQAGLTWLLGHLADGPGDSWQERWDLSVFADGTHRVRELRTGKPRVDGELGHSLMLLCCLRVIHPNLAAFRANRFVRYHQYFEAAQDDADLRRFLDRVDAQDTSPHYKRCARLDVSAALTTQGIAFADLTPEGFLHYATQTRAGGWGAGYEHYVGHLAWKVMHETGHFPPHVPATLRGALRVPAATPAELVDGYQLGNQPVRDLLVDYLTRRSHDLDHSTLRGLARDLCSAFWKQIEQINPDQADLALSEDTYRQWRQALATRRDGEPRLSAEAIATNVRALYLDLQGWAAAEPERWGRWVAPSPIPQQTRARATANRRTKERMDARIRTLQPLLPAFLAAVRDRRDHYQQLLQAASAAEPGQQLRIGASRYQRLYSAGDARAARVHGQANIRVLDLATGKPVNVTFAEDATFWQWATVETLTHTGLRCEELLELSQLSIRQYQRPNGEVIALLVVAPSKTDQERVIPMSPELFHVIATIIRRLTDNRPSVPLATRYDKHERVTSAPQPFLFQRTIGQRTEVITPSALRDELAKLSDTLSAEHPELGQCRFTPHDFRRLFATDLVNHGLPIHIGAALLGHLDLQTTHGYVTVFNEDVVRHYQAHLATRRAQRPTREYRPVATNEWDEFELHFDKRKVELGSCGRPYATPCEHEHACIRCPMLHIDPAMRERLEEIHTDLLARRAQAEAEGWLGELEGIDLTLRFLQDKQAQAQRPAGLTTVDLGLPSHHGQVRP